jgi:hypothetical protein
MPSACFALISIQLVNGVDTDEIISNRHFAKACCIAGIAGIVSGGLAHAYRRWTKVRQEAKL